jgi:hypothetical protein
MHTHKPAKRKCFFPGGEKLEIVVSQTLPSGGEKETNSLPRTSAVDHQGAEDRGRHLSVFMIIGRKTMRIPADTNARFHQDIQGRP